MLSGWQSNWLCGFLCTTFSTDYTLPHMNYQLLRSITFFFLLSLTSLLNTKYRYFKSSTYVRIRALQTAGIVSCY